MSTAFPSLSEELQNINARTISLCRSQISTFVGRPARELPAYGKKHDILVGSYVCGLLQGQIIKSGSLNKWSNDDENLEALGGFAMCMICIGAIIGPTRILHVQSQLPQVSEAQQTDNIMKLDQAGGNDGMDISQGIPLQNGGWLLHYLKNNVSEREIENVVEQADLDSIAANPISNWIYNNGKLILFGVGLLISLVLLSGG